VIRYLLDTSAVLAWYFDEEGGEQVAALFETQAEVYLSVLTYGELSSRLCAVGAVADVEPTWRALAELIDGVLPVSLDTCRRASAMRQRAVSRLPYVDALIAAGALEAKATLVHRDPHFAAVLDEVQQLVLAAAAT
jgi:predicted nucleic acid-binding protein